MREPVSPLLGGLEKTNEAIELQITQEYTGQQRHLCFLVPMWKEVLDFDMHAAAGATPVKELAAGRAFHRELGGFVGVANVGLDANWLGNPMAMANLYGFGRLAWNPNLSASAIIDEWTRLTFGNRSARGENDQRDRAIVLAHVRELHGTARSRNAYRHSGKPLRTGSRVV